MVGNDHLKAARHAAESARVPGEHMSRAELAERVNTWLLDNTGRPGALDRHYLGRLERGQIQRPGRDYRAAFRAVLQASDRDLGFTPDPRTERLHRAAQHPRRADTTALSQAADMLSTVRRLEDETSASAVLPSVAAHAELVNHLADQSKHTAEAVGLASETSQYLGWLKIARDEYGDAQAHLDRAARLALEADDPQRLATALSFAAYRALLLGNYGQAANLNRAAMRDSRVDPGIYAYMHCQAAEIAAYQRDTRSATDLLAKADHHVERLPAPEELPDSSYWYVPPILNGHKGFVLHALGDFEQARQAAREALSNMPEAWVHAEWAAAHRKLAGWEIDQTSTRGVLGPG
ncbi:XRE family transcriptional regulator [Actinopolyspora sp. H202]|uniref:XRE family transcriptional regulator n=1 Tax=Actinopolyspora sp. H202 TaxID=1500456 RepID=UPI003EE5C421